MYVFVRFGTPYVEINRNNVQKYENILYYAKKAVNLPSK